MNTYKYLPIYVALFLTACASAPTGPNVAVSPGRGKSFDQFNIDDSICRRYARDRSYGEVEDSNNRTIRSGAVGTAIGAVAGGLIDGGEGALVGAGTGMLVGGAIGANSSRGAQYSAQDSYDMSYAECMHSRGNNVPGWGRTPPPPPRPYGY